MSTPSDRSVSRRDCLRLSASAIAATALPGIVAAGARIQPPPRFKVGIQSYSLRSYDLAAALEWSEKLGIHNWESFPKHIPTNTETAPELRSQAKARGVAVIGYGVVPFTKDHEANRKFFEFGKVLGIEYLSADPERDAFDSLDRLVAEYGIAVGIHNHGPGHKWATIKSIREAIKDHHKLIGCCVDTGHFLRSKEDPVDAVEAFAGRVYGVHLKDVKNATEFTVLGKGDLRTADLLKKLAEQKYDYCLALEYEEHPEDPIADIKACLKALEAAMPA